MTKSETGGFLTTTAAPPPTKHIKYRADIDGLRAVAVLSVVIYHAFPSVLPGGFVGVDIFFVISGYLISQVLINSLGEGSFSLADFYARRIRRIFPALLAVLLACLAFGWHAMLAEDFAGLAKQTLGGAAFSANFVLWSESGYFDQAAALKPLLHLWSLGIEEQFYLVWPLVLAMGSRSRPRLMILVAIIGLVSFAVNLLGVHSNPIATFYSPISRAWELAIGAAAAILGHPTSVTGQLKGKVVRGIASVTGLGLIACALAFTDSTLPFPGLLALLPTLGAVALVWAGGTAWANAAILSRRPMVLVGLISYPLYLWHWPLLALARGVLGVEPGVTLRLALIALATVLAAASYLLLEKPVRMPGHGTIKVTVLLAAMVLTGTIAAYVYRNDGLASRYPEVVQHATEYDIDGYRRGIRSGRCFLDLSNDPQTFAPECNAPGGEPLWALWGDSGAAALYPGLQAISQSAPKFRLAQFTSSGCPPILGFRSDHNPRCAENNANALARLRALRPSVILLSAMWGDYDLAGLAQTIESLRSQGEPRIVIIGRPPAWTDTPSKIILRLWKDDPFHALPPPRLDYTRYGLDKGERTRQADQQMEAFALDHHAAYISLTQLMCDTQGCIARAPSSHGEAFFLDIVHLNMAGSIYVARLAADSLRKEGGL